MIEVIRSGGRVCIVDRGRYYYRKYGVSISGAMDLHSAFRANSLLHNKMDDALLEISMPGHEFQFHARTIIGLSGASGDITLDEKPIYSENAYRIVEGAVLRIGALHKGCRVYLAVPGGIQSSLILGSRSPIPGYLDRVLSPGDRVNIPPFDQVISKTAVIKPLEIDKNKSIQCTIGPEWYLLSGDQQRKILENQYSIDHKSDRMGYRLVGEPIKETGMSIYSSCVIPGTVQLLPSGLPLILMRDCQTTGGYPRILQISNEDINQVAQRRFGQEITFHLTQY